MRAQPKSHRDIRIGRIPRCYGISDSISIVPGDRMFATCRPESVEIVNDNQQKENLTKSFAEYWVPNSSAPEREVEQALGKYVITFSKVESAVQLLAMELASNPSDPYLFVALSQLSFDQKVHLLRAYTVLRFGEGSRQRGEANGFVKRLRKESATRNRFAHDGWQTSGDQAPIRVEARIKSSFRFEHHRESLDDIARATSRAANLFIDLGTWAKDLLTNH